MTMTSDVARCRALQLIEKQPEITQRELAVQLGISLGGVNYCIKALMARGYVKLGNFRRNPNKRGYTYLLTPSGIEIKSRATTKFLRSKMEEYAALKREIELLVAESPESEAVVRIGKKAG